MRVSFSYRKDKINKDGTMPVALLVTGGGVVFRKNVKGVKVRVSDWDVKSERIKPNKKGSEYNLHVEYNKTLDEVEFKIKELFRYIHLKEIRLSKELINEKLEGGSEALSISPDFFKSFEEFIDRSRSTKAERTIKGYLTTMNYIIDFQSFSGFNVGFDSMNLDFFDKFRDYAFEVKKSKNNYFSKLITILKTFLKWSHERGLHFDREYEKFKAPEDKIEVVYLTIDELFKLYSFEFESVRLAQVRDVYCFACFTGLRFSDLKGLKEANVKEGYLKVNVQKTKLVDHKIPLNEFASSILNKYKGTFYEPIPMISGQKFNQYLKECCEKCGIDSQVMITRYIGRRREDKVVPKYELITSHTARKTFVTNSLVLGMPERIVKEITGHKDEASFSRYVSIADDVKKDEMTRAWNKLER